MGVVVALALVLFGTRLAPATDARSVAGAVIILLLYGFAGWLGVSAADGITPEVLRLAAAGGLVAAAVFATEILLEYVILPEDNTLMGLVEFGTVFGVYFSVGVVATLRARRIRDAVLGASGAALIGSLLWLIMVLTTYYVFRHSPRQVQVFRAEGNYDDFVRSGMKDFDTFVMEDFLGAAFFHLLLGPLIAAMLGGIGGLLLKGVARARGL